MAPHSIAVGSTNEAPHTSPVRQLRGFLEQLLFNQRIAFLLIFLAVTVFLGIQASRLRPDAGFHNMIPAGHPYIANFLKFETELRPLGNVVRIVVENTDGDIYDGTYLETLKKINDEVFYIPGVDRGNLQSLWTPNVMWYEVTETGVSVGTIFPEGFDGSARKIEQVKTNVARSGRIGSLVSKDQRSTIILVPLVESDPDTGLKIDYGLFSDRLEERIRKKYEHDGIQIRVTGFAKLVGDLIHGAQTIAMFFAITIVLSALLLYGYSRCLRSTSVTLLCCSLAVIWQMGMLHLLGFGLNPYSMLVPFLTFAIGVSHAVQNVNTMAAECYRGRSRQDAAKASFRLLFVPGTIALVCDAVGFSTLLIIDIGAIRELAISASIGVFLIIFSKMFLLPVLMSYVGVSKSGLDRQARREEGTHRFADVLSRCTEPRIASIVVLSALAILAGAEFVSKDLKIGDLDAGAPELRSTSRYNQDTAFVVEHYNASSDAFVIMVTSKPGECGTYPVMSAIERLQWEMENIAGVESSVSLATGMKMMIAGSNGGDLKWQALSRNRYISNAAHRNLPSTLFNNDCSMVPVVLFLADHKAETLQRVVVAAEQFAAQHNGADVQFRLAAGNAGIEAATNIVIKKAEGRIMLLVYGIVAALVWWEFKSWRVTLAIMLPLYITSVLCEAIMVTLGLGVKVATLPVIALGVGIGVDYGIYLYNGLAHHMRRGLPLRQAYFETLKTTGSAIIVTGIMLALGVLTWTFSEIKFQADMGLLLAFMFLWNMVGAIVMIPAVMSILSPRHASGDGHSPVAA